MIPLLRWQRDIAAIIVMQVWNRRALNHNSSVFLFLIHMWTVYSFIQSDLYGNGQIWKNIRAPVNQQIFLIRVRGAEYAWSKIWVPTQVDHTHPAQSNFKGCVNTLIVLRGHVRPIGYHPKLRKVKSICAFRTQVWVQLSVIEGLPSLSCLFLSSFNLFCLMGLIVWAVSHCIKAGNTLEELNLQSNEQTYTPTN